MQFMVVLLSVVSALAASNRPLRTVSLRGEVVRGGGLDRTGRSLYTWGDNLRRWDTSTLGSEVLASGNFGEGGCLVDVDGDGRPDIVIEVLGGLEPARTLVLEALQRGIPVVTANKRLLATHGDELFSAALASGRPEPARL